MVAITTIGYVAQCFGERVQLLLQYSRTPDARQVQADVTKLEHGLKNGLTSSGPK